MLENIEDVHIAVDSGDGILVQFIEDGMNGLSQNQNMENINEEDEKSEYSDEQFDEEADEAQTVPRVTKDQVGNALKHVRYLLMIKKVPRTHMVKYLLMGENLERDANKNDEEVIPTKTLATIFERKFNLGGTKATKLARFFVEGPPKSANDEVIEEKEHRTDRETLVKRLREHLPDYMLYNTIAVDSMLSRLQGIASSKASELLDDFNLEDEDSNGFLSFDQIQKVWKYDGLP